MPKTKSAVDPMAAAFAFAQTLAKQAALDALSVGRMEDERDNHLYEAFEVLQRERGRARSEA